MFSRSARGDTLSNYRTLAFGLEFFPAIELSEYWILYWWIRETIRLSDIRSRPQSVGLLDIRLRKTIGCPPLQESAGPWERRLLQHEQVAGLSWVAPFFSARADHSLPLIPLPRSFLSSYSLMLLPLINILSSLSPPLILLFFSLLSALSPHPFSLIFFPSYNTFGSLPPAPPFPPHSSTGLRKYVEITGLIGRQ